MVNYNQNMLNQKIDIGGSDSLNPNRDLSDENLGLGEPISAGSSGIISSASGDVVTITNLSGIISNFIGKFISISNAVNGANNGTFPITEVLSSSSLNFINADVVIPDGGSIDWIIRQPYSLSDDLNFERTDRAAIKGTTFYGALPTFQRPTAIGTDVPSNLSNLKSLDSRGLIINKTNYRHSVNLGDASTLLIDVSNFKHSDAIDKTGVPCFDTSPYVSNYIAALVELTDGYSNAELSVIFGIHQDEKIFGLTVAGVSVSPNSVQIDFYSCPKGGNLATDSSLYTWESGQSNIINCIYGYFKRLDQLNDEDLRQSTIQNLGPTTGGTNTQSGFTNHFLLMGG
jgi:hypothetical protein